MEKSVAGWSLCEELPGPLPAERIVELNQPKTDLHTYRQYEWNGWNFDLPPGVFMPGATSRMLHERLLDGRIDVAGRTYAAMGAGLGVEAIVAGLRGAATVYSVDIHDESVRVTRRYYAEIVGTGAGTTFVPLVSDLCQNLPDDAELDVVTFNPPAVSQMVSDDPDVIRNICVGQPLIARFFAELSERNLLGDGGEVFVVVSNTADLRGIVRSALENGFTAEVYHLHEWHDEVRTYIFRMTK